MNVVTELRRVTKHAAWSTRHLWSTAVLFLPANRQLGHDVSTTSANKCGAPRGSPRRINAHEPVGCAPYCLGRGERGGLCRDDRKGDHSGECRNHRAHLSLHREQMGSAGHRAGAQSRETRPIVPVLLHDQARWDWHGPRDQPLDPRGPWWAAVGSAEQASRRRLSIDPAGRRDAPEGPSLAGAAWPRTAELERLSEGIPCLYSSVIVTNRPVGRSFLSAAKTDASAMAEPHATHYFWFELGTEIVKESRHSDRRRRSLGARGSDKSCQVPGLCRNGVRMC